MNILEVTFRTREPIRIADDSTSQSGQTLTLRHIPGSTVRGLVVNALSGRPGFETIKSRLFSTGVKYLNAYPSGKDGTKHVVLLPSPKGFYEDKAELHFCSVIIDGSFDEGMKRAGLGRFARFAGNEAVYYPVGTGSDLKILSNVKAQKERNVFRNEYIQPGMEFTGYVYCEDEDIKETICGVLNGSLLVGNARSAGYGKCDVSCREVEALPYGEYEPGQDVTGECYLYLLSQTVMRDENGELCGLNLEQLQRQLGVENLRILYCATGASDVKGYNRTWGSKIPSAVMYEAGSVFHMQFDGVLTRQAMRKVREQGLGIRTNEGFGQVLLLKDYASITAKRAGSALRPADRLRRGSDMTKEEKDTLFQIARAYYRQQIEDAMCRYILANPLGKGSESASRLGNLEAYTTSLIYDPQKAIQQIREYYEHAEEKENAQNIHQDRASMKQIKKHVLSVLENPLEKVLDIQTRKKVTVMGIPKKKLLPEEEESRMKLAFLTRQIRFDNKGVE